MTDLNVITERLLSATQAESTNPLFVFAEALAGIMNRREENLLTTEELELAQPTVQRIEKAAQISEYMYRAVGSCRMSGKREIPSYLLQDKDDATNFTALFEHLPNETELVTTMVAAGNATLEQLQEVYADWQELVEQEKLAEAARQKVKVLIDIRACLIGMLRYLGLPGSQIEEIATGEAPAA